ncbi:MAG: mechanosensitive ion channel domain-containing protein [Gammaproteobacteria bacterium]
MLPESETEPGMESIESKLAELEGDGSLQESVRNRLKELYQSALQQLKAAQGYKKETDFYRESALKAAKEIEGLNKELNSTIEESKKSKPIDYRKIPVDQLDSRFFDARLKLESLKNKLEQLGRNLKKEQVRPEQIRIEQSQILDRLQEVEEQQRSVPLSGDGTEKAQLSLLRATEKALQANLNALEMELNSHLPRLQLLRARYDLAIAKVANESAGLESLEKFVAENRESEAERYSKELAEALQAASNKHPLIRESIQQNFELGKEFRSVSEELGIAVKRLDEIKEDVKRLKDQYENSEKKVALAGVSPTLAAILREHRRLLPSDAKIDRIAEKLVAKTSEVTLRQFDIEEKLENFLEIQRRLDDQLASSNQGGDLSKHQLMRIRVELDLLLEEQKSLLTKLNETYSKYLSILGEIDYSKQRLTVIAGDYATFLDENLLWVKSSPPIGLGFFQGLVRAAVWLVSPELWWQSAARLTTVFESRKLLTLPLSLLLLATFAARRMIRARLTEISGLVGVVRNDRFRYTLDSIGLTILEVVPGVAVLYGVGWLLDANGNTPEFARAVGRGLRAASLPLFLLQTFYHIFSPGGIAELHLRWRRKAVSALRSQIAWLRFVVVPCVFLITMTANQAEVEYSDSLGRLALIVAMIAMSISLGKVVNPSRGALKYYLADHSTSLLSKTRYIWYSVALMVPVVIAGFAAAGFLTSAIELQQKLIATIRIVFIALIIHELALRGLRLFNRELALKKLREKRQSEKAAKPVGEAGESMLSIDQSEIDIATINSQTMRVVLTVILFGTLIVLWLLWQDVLPALAILNEWVLWHKTVTVDGVATVKPVAVSNLLIVIVYILVSISATRNLPGLMEVLIMNRFSIDAGSRYAINQLIGYALIAATVILVAAELGGQWSELQWLVAALGVGLGFGLQEIFANFVSGIILLFERPIRIGDTVTIGDISGTVSRIQIRATTITDWERKDLVVPNKTFITDQLINWTRTDNITRILIPIGIAYGSDTELAHRVIANIVRSHPLVLKEPEATVFFVSFGDSSLNFEVRLFVKEISNRLPLIHDLHMQMNQALKEQGIEIPFPQRDLHVRSMPVPSNSPQPVPPSRAPDS